MLKRRLKVLACLGLAAGAFGMEALQTTNWHSGLCLIIMVAGFALALGAGAAGGIIRFDSEVSVDPASILNLHDRPRRWDDESNRDRDDDLSRGWDDEWQRTAAETTEAVRMPRFLFWLLFGLGCAAALFGDVALQATNWHPGLSLIIMVAGCALAFTARIAGGPSRFDAALGVDPASLLNLHDRPRSQDDDSQRGW